MKIQYVCGNEKLLDQLKDLWEALNKIHLEKSIHFKHLYTEYSFAARKEALLAIAQKGLLHIALAYDQNRAIGYCISSLVTGIGEIESLFVSAGYRNNGIATLLMEQSIAWVKQADPQKILVKVSVGNEDVLPFYARFGLLPRLIELESSGTGNTP